MLPNLPTRTRCNLVWWGITIFQIAAALVFALR